MALKRISIPLPPSSAYVHSTTTLHHLRSLLTSGFAWLHWSLSHVRSPSLRFVDLLCVHNRISSHLEICRREFETIVDGLSDALDFSRTIGVDAGVANAYECGGGRGTLGEVDFYTRYAPPRSPRSFPATWAHL